MKTFVSIRTFAIAAFAMVMVCGAVNAADVTFTWRRDASGRASGSFTNAAHWTCGEQMPPADYPSSTSMIAVFPDLGESYTVTLPVNVSVKQLQFGSRFVTLANEGETRHKITPNANTSFTRLVLDGIEIYRNNDHVFASQQLILRNGAYVTVNDLTMNNASGTGLVRVESGSTLTAGKLYLGGGNEIVMDDATFVCRGLAYFCHNNGDCKLVFKGKAPCFNQTANAICSVVRDDCEALFEFRIPEGGYTNGAPVKTVSNGGNPFGGYGSYNGTIRLSVASADGSGDPGEVLVQPLVAWNAGLHTGRVTLGGLPASAASATFVTSETAVDPVWTDVTELSGTVKGLGAKITGQKTDIKWEDHTEPDGSWKSVCTDGLVTFTWTGTEHKRFRHWVNAKGQAVGGDTVLTLTADDAVGVVPVFACDWHLAMDGDDANDGATRETAKATLSAAMACLGSYGDRVVVHDGVYTNSTAYTISNGWQVVSENGAAKTRIEVPSKHTMFTYKTTGGNATVRGFTFAPSAARVQCRVVYIEGGTFADSIVTNLGTTAGEDICQQRGATAVISNCCFYGCQGGGRTAAVVEQWSDGKIYDCKFIGCSGNNSFYGGAVMVYNGFIRNSLIACCTNTSMAGGITFYGSGYAENCTVVDCRTTGSSTVAGGVNVLSGSPSLRNCIVTGCSNSGGDANISGSLTVSCTASYPKPAGEGNVELAKPDFADPAAFDYRVLSGPSIDAGANKAWMLEATDLAGTNRIIKGVVDMGCYENAPSGIKASIQPSAAVTLGSGQVTLTAVVSAAVDTGLTYAWAVTNRMTGAEVLACAGAQYPSVTETFGVGDYDVALTVANDQGESFSTVAAQLFCVKPLTVWVATDGAAEYPYDTKAKAFGALADAVAFGEDGMTVMVADGVYTNAGTIAVGKGIDIRSENGREKTRIVSKNFRQWVLSNSGSRLTGFTLDGNNQGTAIEFNGGRMDDCVITNFQGGSIIVFDKNDVVSNCTMTCCKSTGRDAFVTGGGGGQFLWCQFVDNEFYHNSEYGGISHGVNSVPSFRNCLIARNRYTHDAPTLTYGFVMTMKQNGGLLENCTIVSNRCTNGTKGRVAITHTAGTIRNCIIAFNENENGLADLSTTVPANITHTLVTTENVIDDCEGCFVADPKFKHPSRGDYRLKSKSPAIDKALWQPWMENAKDLNGGPRLLNKAVDLGCYECPMMGMTLVVR